MSQNLSVDEKNKIEEAEIAKAVRAMKKTDWVFVAQMTSPFLFVAATLVAIAFSR